MTTDISIQEAKHTVIAHLHNVPAGKYIRPKDLVKQFKFPETWTPIVGAWVSHHPRAVRWSRTHYLITEAI